MTNQVWRYYSGGTNLGTAWRASTYNDTAWQTGRGVFAYENDNPLVTEQTSTILSLTNGNGQNVIAHYFRTHFVLTNQPYEAYVILTNLIDDGAVFYVNGVEIARENMAAAPSPIVYVSTASSAVEATYTTLLVPYDRLVQGDNVLAVEVHNVSATASPKDLVFGLAASAVAPSTHTPLVITNEPRDVTVSELDPVSLSVGVGGFPITSVQWYLDGTLIPGANQLIYSLTNATLADAGTYSVRLSNSLGGVVSAPALLTIVADTNAPQILRAEASDSLTNVVITFNERLLPVTATNVNYYQVAQIGSSASLSVSRAVLSANGLNVTLTLSGPLLANENYLLWVNGVRDNTLRTNLATSLLFPIFRTFSLLDEYSFFYFYNPFVTQEPVGPGDDNPDLGTAWRQPEYVVNEQTNNFWADNAWTPGAFYIGTAGLPTAKGTELSSSLAPVVYFRAPVYYPVSPIGADLLLQYMVQDGGVLYLNGDEFYRVYMNPGEVSWNTRATSLPAVPAAWLGPYSFRGLGFNHGWNTISAELHSYLVPQTNMTFALRVQTRAGSFAKGPVVITTQPASQTVHEGRAATFSFMAAGPAYFQWFQNGVVIPGATHASYTIPFVALSMDGAQVSVLAWNNESSVMSSNAVLTVQQDFSPLGLRSAYAISSNQILVSFSKPVDPVTATEIGNYQLTNGVGADMVVLSSTVTNGTNVLLQVVPGSGNILHVLVVNKVRDTTFVGNTVFPNSAVTVGLELFFPVDTSWKYEASGSNLGTNWRSVAYSDSAWAEGQGLLCNESGGVPAPKNTLLPLVTPNGTKIITYYLRNPLTLPTGATNAVLTLRHVVDDGAIFYLDGKEFYRYTMPTGTIQWNTFAASTIGDASFDNPVNYGLTNLAGGNHVLAAEVHAANNVDSDVCFGAEIRITAPSVALPIPTLPRLAVSRLNGTTQLGWTNTGFILQRAVRLDGTNTVWEDILDSRSPHKITDAEGAGFYRLKR